MKSPSNYEVFLDLVGDYKRHLLLMGGALADAKESYQELVGDGIDTWHDFLAQPEIGMTVREANGLIKLYEWAGLQSVPFQDMNLSAAKFAANKGLDISGVEDDITSLSLKDFKERHYDNSVQQDNAPRTYKYVLMKLCNETLSLIHI